MTTAGGVEEDLIKCLAPTYIGDFSLRGQELRQSGINRYMGPPLGQGGPLYYQGASSGAAPDPDSQDWEPLGAQR